jgi:hypothetical protein
MAVLPPLGNRARSRSHEYFRNLKGLADLAKGVMLYYNKTRMTAHDHHAHHRHHHAGAVHPPSAAHPSILRLSAVERLAVAATVIAVLWAAAFWAMG